LDYSSSNNNYQGLLSDDSSAGYGNPGIDACGVPEGGDGVIELGGSVVVGSAGVAKGVFGIPHTCDSVVLINLSVGSAL
jgi:hypothetical protein